MTLFEIIVHEKHKKHEMKPKLVIDVRVFRVFRGLCFFGNI